MIYKDLHLDKFQEDAIHAIDNGHSVVVSAPTGSGKTLIADYIINRDIKKKIRVIYTAPIKALSNQKYKDFCKEYGEENVGLLTGDIVKNPNGLILVMTTEIYRNMLITNDSMVENISYIIFDEIHYINDIERGYVWEESIIFSRKQTRMLCLSATIPNARQFAQWIEKIKKHKVEIIEHDERPVPLHKSFYDSELGITTLKKIFNEINTPKYDNFYKNRFKYQTPKPNHIELIKDHQKFPCLFFSFSRADCEKKAGELSKKNIFNHDPKITALIRNKLEEMPEISKLKSTQLLRETLPKGIGFHHAGLLPIMKDIVEELFSQGKIKVLYTTETFAVGINMPAKTVCFNSLRKYDGINFRILNSKEFFQIAGRAGRRGIDKEGFVYVMLDRRDFEYSKIKRITTKDTEPINSQFKLSVNTVLNLVKNHSKKEIEEILKKSFYSFQKKDYQKIYLEYKNIKKKLEKRNYIKNNLTDKGEFTSKIYADELIIGEIFGTNLYQKLNEYQLLLIITSLCFEPREKTKIYKKYMENVKDLQKTLKQNHYLGRFKKIKQIHDVTGFVHLVFYGKSFFDILKNTNLLEGDIIRMFRQVIDRINQIKNATQDMRLEAMLNSCKDLILNCIGEFV